MTAANRRAALGALDRVRPLVDNLHRNRPSEELAADLTAAWEQLEVVLRALLGGTALAGQQLVRELRQRELVSLEQAHTLLAFHAARDRAGLPGYQVAAGDVTAARDAIATLDEMLGGVPASGAAAYGAAAYGAPATAGATGGPAPGATAPRPPSRPTDFAAAPGGATTAPPAGLPDAGGRRGWRGIPSGVLLALLALLLIGLPLGGWWLYTSRVGGPRSLAAAEQLYANGNKAQARAAFAEIAREAPDLALPHVYLGRLAREQGDVALAQQELQLAVRAEPNNAVAQREMGSLMLATGNPDLARRFYTRALELNQDDRVAAGYLGCALAQLGQLELASRFIARAGAGDWQACLAPGMAPGMLPPGMMPPGTVPPGAALLPPAGTVPPR